MENILNGLKQVLPIVDIDVELSLNSVVDKDTRLDIHVVIFVIPMSLKSDGDTIPPVWIDVSQTIADNIDYTPCKDVWLLV